MLTPFILLSGLVALVWSADRFVAGAAATGKNLGISKLLIGLTIVSIGTSAPEICVAIVDSIEGLPYIAIGNAIGSNTCNTGLVLGITAMITPLPFAKSTLRVELPWLIGVTLLTGICLFDLHLGTIDGIIFIVILLTIMVWLVRGARRDGHLSENLKEELDGIPALPRAKGVFWLIVGLVILICSAHAVVYSAEKIALAIGVDEMLIGLTLVAVGTSLPELAATVTAAVKGHVEIAIGNVVGSNVLNILAVLSLPALIQPSELDHLFLWRDYGVMLALTTLLAFFAYGIGSKRVITRFEGSIFLVSFIAYYVLLYYQM